MRDQIGRTGHRFGAHLSIAGAMHHALVAALRLGCDTVQVFVRNQRQWRANPLDPDDVARWHELRATPGFGPVVAHTGYLINVASPDPALLARSRAALAEELARCDTLEIPYLVLHPGSAMNAPRNQAVPRVAAAINRVLGRFPSSRTMLLLETTAGQGTALGRSFAELGTIMALLEQPQRVGVCIDTCHVFAAGYDIRQPAAYAAMVADAAQTVGLKHIRCWHLNDSLGKCGGRLDRHAHIGRGRLGVAGFRNVLADARFAGLPMIIETPKGADDAGRDWDRVNLRRLRTIARQVAAAGGSDDNRPCGSSRGVPI